MPPKFKFSKSEITDAALNIVRANGVGALTARSLAQSLGASPKVIFGLFENMDEVHRCVKIAAKQLYGSYVEKGLADEKPFKGVGEQYILFSVNEPKLFQLLFMSEKKDVPALSGVLPLIDDNYEKILASICADNRADKRDAEKIYKHLWIYTHGIASLCATGMCRFSAEELSEMLTDVYIGVLIKLERGRASKEDSNDKR